MQHDLQFQLYFRELKLLGQLLFSLKISPGCPTFQHDRRLPFLDVNFDAITIRVTFEAMNKIESWIKSNQVQKQESQFVQRQKPFSDSQMSTYWNHTCNFVDFVSHRKAHTSRSGTGPFPDSLSRFPSADFWDIRRRCQNTATPVHTWRFVRPGIWLLSARSDNYGSTANFCR